MAGGSRVICIWKELSRISILTSIFYLYNFCYLTVLFFFIYVGSSKHCILSIHTSRVLWYGPWIYTLLTLTFRSLLTLEILCSPLSLKGKTTLESHVESETLRVVLLCCLVSGWFMWEHHTNNFQLLWPSIWNIYLASNINVSFLKWTFRLSVLVTGCFVHFVLTSEFCCLIYRFVEMSFDDTFPGFMCNQFV